MASLRSGISSHTQLDKEKRHVRYYYIDYYCFIDNTPFTNRAVKYKCKIKPIIPITDSPYGLDDFMCSIMMFILGQKERNAEL